MNEKLEKKRRDNLRLEFIAHFNKWLDSEPPRWRFIRWRKWKKSRPVWEDAAGPTKKQNESFTRTLRGKHLPRSGSKARRANG